MKRRQHRSVALRKSFQACVCLLAVLLLWAPLWAGACTSKSKACCTGNQCPAHGRAMKNLAASEGGQTEAAMDCGHSRQGSMSSCSISCCQEKSTSLVAPGVYLLPEPVAEKASSGFGGQVVVPEADAMQLSFVPPAPPPRNAVL